MQYRNIAICGVSPEMMEYPINSYSGTLMEDLYSLKGVIRVDTHTRTPTLGKWHITVDQTKYLETCENIDRILDTTFATFPENIRQEGKYQDFLHPRRLDKLTRTSDSSVSIDMTK